MAGREASGWRVVTTDDGSPTLAHPVHGEACHSRSGAWLEARERYARPCRLRERALGPALSPVVRVLDVGTGLGLNVAAALEAVEGASAGVHLDVVTIEVDRAVLEAALELPARAALAPELERWHAPVRRALGLALEAALVLPGSAVPLGARGRLRLWLDDASTAIDTIPASQRFDAVFLDPFSRRADERLWSPSFLRRLAGRVAPGGWLSTYTSSFRVRAALYAAGLRVGPGPLVGAKHDGTLASPDLDPGPLEPRLARRLERRFGAPKSP